MPATMDAMTTALNPKPSALDLDPDGLAELVTSIGQPRYRARQVMRWLYRGVRSFDEMTDLPKPLRTALAERVAASSLKPSRSTRSSDGVTTKVLFRLADGALVESVHMRHAGAKNKVRTTICVSSQAGCAYGCAFCATGQGGYGRNLTSGEILEQILFFLREDEGQTDALPLPANSRPVTNIVFMGMGEPFANYDNVMQSLRALNAPWGLGLGARHMTVSTVGLVPQIHQFTAEPLQIGLAISLHAPNDELRDSIMPVNRKYSLAELMPACREYVAATGRRITFEYVLLAGVNDSDEQARELARLLRGLLCHVNLIPMNPTASSLFARPSGERMRAFAEVLDLAGIPVTLRDTQGGDIQAACGQLRTSAQRLDPD